MKRRNPTWVDERDVLAVHSHVLAAYGGRPGLRDEGLLRSALARPRQHHGYSRQSDAIEMAALYTAGIVRNDPFVDGNKQAGFVAGVLFLELNGFTFTASEEDASQAVFGLAAGTLDEAAYTAWLRASRKRGTNR